MTSAVEIAHAAKSIRIPVTAGNLRNGHVYLRDFLWFFPKTAIKNGRAIDSQESEACILELPGGNPIKTMIDADKGIFRWRGWKKVFQAESVRAGDFIVFSRLERHRFGVSVEHSVLDGLAGALEPARESPGVAPRQPRSIKRCNDLTGDEWLRFSISIWSDIRKTAEEASLNHPAMFPTMLCERIISMFLRRRGRHRVLDPFVGSGSTMVAAHNLGKVGVGFDISPDYIALARTRVGKPGLFASSAPPPELHLADAREMEKFVKPNSIDLCITSPPYWDILNQKRSADSKEIRNYGNLEGDLGTIETYEEFLTDLANVFGKVHDVLRPGGYCIVVVMDLRKRDQFYPFHSDLAAKLSEKGFVLDDTVIWNRQQEYNNLRPLGYPAVLRINKVHEFILIFQKRS